MNLDLPSFLVIHISSSFYILNLIHILFFENSSIFPAVQSFQVKRSINIIMCTQIFAFFFSLFFLFRCSFLFYLFFYLVVSISLFSLFRCSLSRCFRSFAVLVISLFSSSRCFSSPAVLFLAVFLPTVLPSSCLFSLRC